MQPPPDPSIESNPMSDETPDERIDDLIDADGHIDNDPEPKTWRDAMPFFLAAGFVAIVVLIISLVAIFSPPGERVNDSSSVQFVVNEAYTARNALNYAQYRNAFCETDLQNPDFPQQQQWLDENRDARNADGPIVIPKMDVDVQGDTAKVTVYEHREGNEDNKSTDELTVVKQGEQWKVCTP